MDKAYIEAKISKCIRLVENATSEAQREIYQGYLDHWKSFDKKSSIVEVSPGVTEKSEETIVDINDYADIFEIENAPKQAYYKRNGQWIKTKAFKEYLKSVAK